MNELSRTNNFNHRGTQDIKRLDYRTKFSFSPGSTRQDYLHGCRWFFESRYCPKVASITANGSVMAPTIFILAPIRVGEGCSASRSQAKNSSTQSGCCHHGHTTQQAFKCDSLEHQYHGRISRTQPVHRDTSLAKTQLEAASCRNIQTQPRQTFQREASRCSRPLPQSSRQGFGSLCRREESNPSSRSNAANNPITSRYSSAPDSRLHASRHDNFIRGFEHARWQSYRRLHATAQTSGIYSILTIDQCPNAKRFGIASYCRQLWNTQTCARQNMVETSPQIPFAFYSNIQFMAQYGRTLVPRNHRQAYSPRLIQKRSRINQRHYAISRKS